jgi:hypothetical protein
MNLENGNDAAALTAARPDVFALTDEQILELEPEEGPGERIDQLEVEPTATVREESEGRSKVRPLQEERAGAGRQDAGATGEKNAQEPPGWLAREMKDRWVGDEARELWEGVQRAQREAAAYREAFATPEDARALKEIYPGGVAEAKSAAERARELTEIDAVFFGAAGKPQGELRAGRTALVEKLYAQNPVGFREMVEAGVRILGGAGVRSNEEGSVSHDATALPGSLQSDSQKARLSGRDDSLAGNPQAQVQDVQAYREFERATNEELEKSVGGAIGRAMDAALPNLRQVNGVGGEGPFGQTQGKQAPRLQERLRSAVREEVEAALRSDASLGEQVARVLGGRRLDESARAQVVRLINARAQQLVPGAVRRVVGSWTQATLGARKAEANSEAANGRGQGRAERPATAPRRAEHSNEGAGRSVTRSRVDYRKLSDEQILGM